MTTPDAAAFVTQTKLAIALAANSGNLGPHKLRI